MKNLIFVISFCAFFSFSFVSSNFFTPENNFLYSDLSWNSFSSENKLVKFLNPSDSAEPESDSNEVENPIGNGVTDIANMFNERGFYKSNGFSFDEQEIINDFNGNLMYQIPLYNYPLAGDLNFNLSLNYNGSTGHQFFIGNTNTYNSNPDQNRYNINSPEWIISLNGIAVQVLNFETDFFFNPPTGQSLDTNIHTLIPGYHIDGSLQAVSETVLNKINILAGDGSLITLVNENSSSYIGNYSTLGKESYYKAKVSFIESSNTEGYRRRLVKLYRGDGSIFIFREYKQNFYDFRTDVIVNERRKPMMLLLEEIKDGFGHQINLSYSFNDPNPVFPAPIDGHPLLKNIQAMGYSESNISINFEYYQSNLNIEHNSSVNGNYQLTFERPIYYTHVGKYHKAMIHKISNCINQTSIINYEPYFRKFLNLNNPLYNPSSIDLLMGNLYRIKSFKNILNGVRNYSYLDGINNFLQVDGNNQRMKSNIYRGFGRDAFYVNMINQKSDTNDTNPNSITDFSYSYQDLGNTNSTTEIDQDDNYESIRTVYSLNSNTVNQSQNPIQFKKRYKVYPIFNVFSLYLENQDVEGITKIVSDSTFAGNETSPLDGNSYSYELGAFEYNYYTGSFLLNGKTNVKQGKQSHWNYSYSYESNDYEKPILSKTETDPIGNKLLTSFDNLYKENIIHKKMSNLLSGLGTNDTTTFYKILLTKQEKRLDQNNNILSKRSLAYITDTSNSKGYYGQLIYDTLFNNFTSSDYILTQYEYYKNDFYGNEVYTGDFYPYKEGNIKSILKPEGQQTRFFYTPTSSSEIQYTEALEDNGPKVKYKIKYVNGLVKDTADRMWDTRFPIRIENGKLSGSTFDILSREYKNYSIDGSPTRMINQNNFLTELQYEPIHRINSITLPGDFSTIPNTIDTTIIHHYVEDTLIIFSNKWGNYNANDSFVYYANNAQSLSNENCNTLFRTYQKYLNENLNAFMGFENEYIQNLDSIYSASLEIFPYSYTHIINGNNNPDTTKYKTFIYPISQLGVLGNFQCLPGTSADNNPATLENNMYSQIFININSGSYTSNRCDVKNILDNLKSSFKQLKGFVLKVKTYTRDEEEAFEEDAEENPFSYEYDIKFTLFPTSEYINWINNYSPKLKVIGRFDFPDTVYTPVVHGGTVVYSYDNIEHTSDIYSIRDLNHMDKSRIKHKIDGFGNVKEKIIYTSDTESNSYKYKFNYMNNIAENFDALSQSTQFSYDGLGRLIKTKNSDTSTTFNYFAYYDTMGNYFGNNFIGFIEKQTFEDEEGNEFEKFFDAVGNLLRERKFIEASTVGDDPPAYLTTDYKYDSLYRVTKVKTPTGKYIYYYYDGYGRQSKRITPDAGQTEYFYDKNSNLTYSQDANQRTADIHKYTFRNYDGLNRLTGIGENIFLDDSPSSGEQYNSTNADLYLTINVYDTVTSAIVNSLFTVPLDYSYPGYTTGNLVSTAYRTRNTDTWNFKYYKYDVRGRVIKMWNIISGFDTLITEYIYNSQDQIIIYSHSGNGDPKTFRNTYDPAGRLDNVKYYAGWPDDPYPNYVNLAEYLYNENSQVDQQLLNDGGLKLNFYYNNRQWISEILESSDLINMVNDYFKNGNVKSQQLSGSYNDMFSNNSDLYQNYKYDKSNRLLESENNNQQYKDHYKIENKYDKDGNILELKRYDGAGSVMDNFNYAYYSNTNKLQKVTGTDTQYEYDFNGNMKTDNLNRNRDIKYDHRNLITQLTHKQIVFEDSLLYSTYYYYDEAGNRIRKKVYQYTGIQPADSVTPPEAEEIGDSPGLWDLVKDEVYSRSVDGRELVLYVNGSLKQSNIWGIGNEGYLTNADEPYFYMKDHLGSIRALTNDKNEVISSQDYDAWGYLLQGRQYESDESVYKFTGKERDEESEYDYSYARNYNSRIGLFNSSEPIPSSSFGWGSYVYCGDNPLKIIDPSGEDWFYIYDEEGGGTWEYDEVEGKNVWTGRYDENKNKIMEWKQGYEELLFFQGNQLQWLQENGNIEYWYAVSGELDKYKQTNPLFEHVPEKGPIPQGWWTVDPQNAYSIDKSQGIIDYLKWKYYRKGPFGEAYINISPAPDNPTNRREGFSIHGGDEPGSIGCIDLTSGMNDFYNKFVIHNKSMLLNVDYSKFTP